MPDDQKTTEEDLAEITRDIGRRLREIRVQCGYSQKDVGDQLSKSYQIVQKYEHGETPITAAHLALLAREMGVPVVFFYEGGGEAAPETSEGTREIIELVRGFRRIPRAEQRRRLVDFIRTLGEADQ